MRRVREDLKNSQRISYKATSVQKSATTKSSDNPKDGHNSHMKAVEKAAFIQMLRLIPEELTTIKRRSMDEAVDSGERAALTGALGAIETLISDTTASSTLNNASLFAKIDSGLLIKIPDFVIAPRVSTAEAIKVAIAQISAAYKESLIQPPKDSSSTPASTNLPQWVK